MAGEIFVHACHILKRAETWLVASQNILPDTKNLFPLSWHGERAYSKSKAPTEIGNQTNWNQILNPLRITDWQVLPS